MFAAVLIACVVGQNLGAEAAERLARAGVEFQVPPGFEPAAAEPPALACAALARRGTAEVRLTLFVVPVAADAPQMEVRETALHVASFWARFRSTAEELQDGGGRFRVLCADVAEARALYVVPERDRYLALLAYGVPAAFAERTADLEAAAASIRAATRQEPAPSLRHADAALGFALALPAGYAVEQGADLVRFTATPPHHFGLRLRVVAEVVDAGRLLPLAEFAAAERRRLEDAGFEVSDAPVPPEFPLPAQGVRAHEPAAAFTREIRWVDLESFRVAVSFRAPDARWSEREATCAAVLDSIVPVPRALTVALAARYSDGEAGFSLRPPAGFARTSKPDSLVAFAERFVRREDPARFAVRSGPASAIKGDVAACVAALEAVAAAARERGLSPLAPPSGRLLNGRPAAFLALAGGEGASDRFEQHFLVASRTASFDLVLETRVGDRTAHAPLAEASVRTLELAAQRLAPELAGVHSRRRVQFRPPAGFASTGGSGGDLATFAGDAGGARVELGVDPLPGHDLLGSSAEHYRRHVVESLLQAGCRGVRVEEAETERNGDALRMILRLAYDAGSGEVCELRRAIQLDDGMYFARAIAEADSFAVYEKVFEASLGSLEANAAVK